MYFSQALFPHDLSRYFKNDFVDLKFMDKIIKTLIIYWLFCDGPPKSTRVAA